MAQMFNRRSRVAEDIPTASMADIAFLLLIFFLTTTVFNEEKGLGLTLPEKKAEEVLINPKNILHIFVAADGSVSLQRGKGPDIQRIDYRDLAEIFTEELRANPNLIAAVKVDRRAKYIQMVNVLDELKLAKATRISLQPWDREG